jgi:O-antigen ligase
MGLIQYSKHVKTNQNLRFAQAVLLIAGCSVTLFVSPWNSIDPMNMPKMTILIFLSLLGFGASLAARPATLSQSRRDLFALAFFFIFWLSIVTIFNKSEVWTKLYGTPGRNTGFLSYLSLALIMLSVALVVDSTFLKRTSICLIFLGAALSFYGLLQYSGIEFFNYTGAGTSVSFGTFGNVNFQSAFLGMVASLTLSLGVFQRVALKSRFLLISLCTIMVTAIQVSSAQGFFSLIAGFGFSMIIWLASKRIWKLVSALVVLYFCGSLTLLLGFLNHGPLARFVFSESIEVRGFYWHAAYRMIKENPIFGVGLDNYGDFYRSLRSSTAITYNSELTSDAAHSIPLDIAAGGGVLLLLIYLAILSLALISIVKVVRRSSDTNPFFIGIAGAWAAYQSQTLISINQLGVGIWGWILTGILIGYEINSRKDLEGIKEKAARKVQLSNQASGTFALSIFVAGVIGALASLPPYLTSNSYYQAIQSGKIERLVSTTYSKPYDKIRFLNTIDNLVANKMEPEAIEMLKKATVVYPNSFELWQQWSGIESATPVQLAKAKTEMKRLDPNNPNWR